MMIYILLMVGIENNGNIPEMSVCGINFLFSVGGDDKKNSSSWILKNGSIITKKDYGGLFITYLSKSKLK